jgi:hypothetical protein
MLEEHRERIERAVGDGLVLDVGGWAEPFPRADYVLDMFPYETRRLAYHGVGRLPRTVTYPDPLPGERFSRDSWVVQDICGPDPFPFADKQFDFVVCSHTLEDIRDPLWTCSEMIRIGKAGYIETPSRLMESLLNDDGSVGALHHRWFVEIEGRRVAFRLKPHFLHISRKYHVPQRFMRRRHASDLVASLFWSEDFDYEEVIGYEFYSEAAAYVSALGVPAHLYALDAARRVVRSIGDAAGRKKSEAGALEVAGEELWTWEELFRVSAGLAGGDSRVG